MHAGTILFNGTDLSTLGKPRLKIDRRGEPAAFPTRQAVTLTVTVALEARDPGTILARLRYLQETMQTGEGLLQTASGSGAGASWMATPTGDTLAAAMTGNTNSVDLTFSAWENHPQAAVQAVPMATFLPAGATVPITLHAVREPKTEIRTERHAERASARKATLVSRSFKARVAQANAADPVAARLTYLRAQAEAIAGLNSRDGVLTYEGETAVVRVQQFSPVIDETRMALDVEVQCYHVVLPDAAKAESAYDLRTRQDEGSGEEVLNLSGTIEAETRAIAVAKLESIRAGIVTAGRRLVSLETADRVIDGADTEGVAGAEWSGGLGFSMEVRSPASGSRYNLKITTARDIRAGMRWNYSGSVKAADEAAALAVARGLAAAAAHPVQTRSEEAVEWVTELTEPHAARFAKLDFSYDFEGPADGFIGGEIATDLSRPLFGEWRRTVSGYLVAADRATAEARLTALLAGEGLALETTRRWSEVYHDPTGNAATPARVFQKLDFSSNARETRTAASTKFSDTTSTDATSLTQTRSISGSLWSNTEANAETAFAELVQALFGTAVPQKLSKTHQRERSGTTAISTAANPAWVQLDFSMERTDKMTGTPGFDIIEASYTLQRTGAIQQTIVTPVPFGVPVAQANTGKIPGSMVLNARCKARLSATAKAWVQGKRSLVTTIGTAGVTRHETAQPQETEGPEYAPFSGTEVTTWSFTGTYQWTFTGSVLDGTW